MYSEQQHYIICKLKELSQELNRTPRFDEFKKQFPRLDIPILFGSYDNLLVLSGLTQREEKIQVQEMKKKKQILFDSIIDQLFDYSEHKNKVPKVIETSGNTTMVIGDTHFPFANVANIIRAAEFAERIKPDNIVQLGDLYDYYALSKFPRSRNCYSPYEEVALGKAMAKRFWEELRRASPKSFCYQLLGNHDERPHKRVLESCPDAEVFFAFRSAFEFEGVKTIFDLREELELDSRLYFHYRKKIGTNAPHFGKSCTFGHTHREELKRFDFGNGSVFEYNVGLFGDPTSKELSYTPSKVTHWTLGGLGLIDDLGPRGLNQSL